MLRQENGVLQVPLSEAPRPRQESEFLHIWRVGEWSFDDRDEADIELVEEAILAWTGWLAFLRSGGLDGTQAQS